MEGRMSETLEQHLIRIRDYMVANPDADDHTVARALGTSTRFCHIAGRTYGVGKSFHATVRRKAMETTLRTFPDAKLRDIAKAFGVDESVVHRQARKLGIRKNPSHCKDTLPALREAVATDLRAGKRYSDILLKHGVSSFFIFKVRKRYGLRPWQNPRGRQVMADELAEMRRMQAEGKTHVEIAAAVGKHPNTVWKRLNGWVSKRKATE
jgi:transposase-like protein